MTRPRGDVGVKLPRFEFQICRLTDYAVEGPPSLILAARGRIKVGTHPVSMLFRGFKPRYFLCLGASSSSFGWRRYIGGYVNSIPTSEPETLVDVCDYNQDVFDTHERGMIMGVYYAAPLTDPARAAEYVVVSFAIHVRLISIAMAPSSFIIRKPFCAPVSS